jgi:transcription elongation factor Elf1
MPKLVQAPLITYTCPSCGAVSSADPHEFKALNTMPPVYTAECAFCKKKVQCSPQAMIAREVGAMSDAQVLSYMANRFR